MGHLLKNNNVVLELDLPTENYLGARFDWSGKVTRVSYRGTPVSGSERKDPPAKRWGQAFYNEFGIQEAIGFDEIEVGGWFHKIGVGLLQKNEETYHFHKDHVIKPCDFDVHLGKREVRIHSVGPMTNGYAYELLKIIRLHESGFSLSYELTNTGHKPISTNEYCHNFLAVNDEDLGTGYVLKFPFGLDENSFDEVVNPEGLVTCKKNAFLWSGRPSEQFFFSDLSGGKTVSAEWELIHESSGICIRERCDFKTCKINLWGWSHVVSPELFFSIFIEPGQARHWTRNYEIFQI